MPVDLKQSGSASSTKRMKGVVEKANDDGKTVFDKAGDVLMRSGSPVGFGWGVGLKIHPANLAYKGAKAAYGAVSDWWNKKD